MDTDGRSRARVLDELRSSIARLERTGTVFQDRSHLPFGHEALDAGLPGGGLSLSAVHEVAGAGADIEHGTAAALFVAGVLARLPGPVLWALERRDREWNRPGGYRPVLCHARFAFLVQEHAMTVAKWTVWVEVARPDGTSERHEVGSVQRSLSSPDPDDLGLRLAEAKEFLHQLQLRLVQDQVDQASALDRTCAGCGSRRALHDHRRRVVATLFGRVATRQPRWRPCRCRRSEADAPNSVRALLSARATPELVRVQAELGARLSFREAARVMGLLLPASSAANHTGVRRRLARAADRLQVRDHASPHRMSLARGSPVVVSLDDAHIRAVPGCQTRHFEVTVGCVEAEGRPARHFAVAPHVPASRPGTIGNALRAQGWLPGREVVVLSDGDPALVGAVRSATREIVTHILDWFHISMRVRHVEQALAGLIGSELSTRGHSTTPSSTWSASGT